MQDSNDFFSLRLIQAFAEIPVNSNTNAIESIWNSATFYDNSVLDSTLEQNFQAQT